MVAAGTLEEFEGYGEPNEKSGPIGPLLSWIN